MATSSATLWRTTMARSRLLQQQQRRVVVSVFGSIQSSPIWPHWQQHHRKQQRSISYSRLGLDERKTREQSKRNLVHLFSLSSFSTNSNNKNDAVVFDVEVDYISPLGDMISRLKMVSITGCVLGLVVMPALVYLKNGDLPNAQQATIGTIATIGATGSTAALHFVFGAYVLDMKSISYSSDKNNNDDDDDKILLQATTRSVLGFKKNTHVFDPVTDITKYEGNRPFANFCANGTPLFVHPDRLDSTTRQLLLPHLAKNQIEVEEKDVEGLKKKKKDDDDDDELF